MDFAGVVRAVWEGDGEAKEIGERGLRRHADSGKGLVGCVDGPGSVMGSATGSGCTGGVGALGLTVFLFCCSHVGISPRNIVDG